jgi:glycosyltransferase involved in cell wall biosynthesis
LAEKRPTILQIIPELDTGGAELSTVEIAGAIVRAGGRALVLSEGGRLARFITDAGGEFIPFPAATKNPLHILWNARNIAKLIEEEDVDLVHARSRAPAWSAKLAARRTEKAFVTTYHGAYGERGRLKRAYNRVMADGDVVIANSGYTGSLIQSRYGTPESRIRVIHRGVDGNEFDPAAIAPSRSKALRESWGVGPQTRIILQAARLTGWKGQSVVIEAARLLKEQGRLSDAVIVLAGDAQGRDTYRQKLEAEIAAAGLEGRVLLVGHVADMPAAYTAAHLAIVASTEPEAFGRVATEAQIMGCPVIATAIGAPPETVLAPPKVGAAERTGWLVPPGDARELAEAIESALGLPPADRAALGARARAHVLQSFTLDAMCRATLRVYDGLLGTALEAGYQAQIYTDPRPNGLHERPGA